MSKHLNFTEVRRLSNGIWMFEAERVSFAFPFIMVKSISLRIDSCGQNMITAKANQNIHDECEVGR